MIFHQVYLEALGHASYLVGSEQTGEALVLDVRRVVDAYDALARGSGSQVANLLGGFAAWKMSGLPVEGAATR